MVTQHVANPYDHPFAPCRLGDPDAFVFNMSVGYDLEGIKSPKVDKYINDMIEAKDTEVFKECINWALELSLIHI